MKLSQSVGVVSEDASGGSIVGFLIGYTFEEFECQPLRLRPTG
jgi:hypothetical protein